jgi:hypothetical protein
MLCRALWLATLLMLSANQFARAEIVVDDFDEPDQVFEVSNGFEQHPVTTEHIGDLDASRKLLVTASQTIPDGWSFDTGVHATSTLSAAIHGHSRTSTNSAVITFPVSYTFLPVDMTENGANTTLLFDFVSQDGTERPLLFRVSVSALSASGTSHDVYTSFVNDLKLSTTPFTTVVPFSTFSTRGGGPPAPDFSTFRPSVLSIDFFFLNPVENIQWSMELDRIRIGNFPIPEPSSFWLGAIGVLIVTIGRASRGL